MDEMDQVRGLSGERGGKGTEGGGGREVGREKVRRGAGKSRVRTVKKNRNKQNEKRLRIPLSQAGIGLNPPGTKM